METKLVEIRDKGTFIPALAVQLVTVIGQEDYLLSRAGFGEKSPFRGYPWVILVPLEDLGRTAYAPNRGSRTYDTVHMYLYEHWDAVRSGDVLDVEFILGETDAPKVSERVDESRWSHG